MNHITEPWEGHNIMQPTTIGLAILLLGVLAAAGTLIRASWGLTQRLFLPVSIIAGLPHRNTREDSGVGRDPQMRSRWSPVHRS